ncbi:dienelactone hydrolase family protein [Glutamicibacter endophyticus]
MSRVIVIHHVQGLTPGIRQMAEQIAAWGHEVHCLDLFDGALPASLEEGIELAEGLGQGPLSARAAEEIAALGGADTLIGTSFGAAVAQQLAQQGSGVSRLICLEAFIDPAGPWSFGPWPESLRAQIHGMEQDPYFAEEGDLEAAQNFIASPSGAGSELFTYPGSSHLFTDPSLPGHDPASYERVLERIRTFLES